MPADVFEVGTLVANIELQDRLTPAIARVAGKIMEVSRTVQDFGRSIVNLVRDSDRTGNILVSMFSRTAAAAGLVVGGIAAIGSAILNLAMRGGQAAGIEESFRRMADSAGLAADAILNKLDAALKSTVDNTAQMETLTKLMGAGVKLTAENMNDLGEAARAVGKATGTDAASGLDQLTFALTRGSDRMLRRIGITANMEEAEKKLANSLGVTRSELNEEGRLLARREAIFEAMRKYVERVGVAQLSLGEKIKQVRVWLGNWFEDIEKGVARSKDVSAAWDAVADAVKRIFAGADKRVADIIIDNVNRFARAVQNAVPYVETIIGKIRGFWDWLKELNERYQLTERLTAGVQTAFGLLRRAVDFVRDAGTTLLNVWDAMPGWMQGLAEKATASAIGFYAIGKAAEVVRSPVHAFMQTLDLWINVTANAMTAGHLFSTGLTNLATKQGLLGTASRGLLFTLTALQRPLVALGVLYPKVAADATVAALANDKLAASLGRINGILAASHMNVGSKIPKTMAGAGTAIGMASEAELAPKINTDPLAGAVASRMSFAPPGAAPGAWAALLGPITMVATAIGLVTFGLKELTGSWTTAFTITLPPVGMAMRAWQDLSTHVKQHQDVLDDFRTIAVGNFIIYRNELQKVGDAVQTVMRAMADSLQATARAGVTNLRAMASAGVEAARGLARAAKSEGFAGQMTEAAMRVTGLRDAFASLGQSVPVATNAMSMSFPILSTLVKLASMGEEDVKAWRFGLRMVAEDVKRRAGIKDEGHVAAAPQVDPQRTADIQRIQRDISGERVANEVDKLHKAFLALSPAQQRAEETMRRVGAQASALRKEGGRLHPELARLADAFDKANESAGDLVIDRAKEAWEQLKIQMRDVAGASKPLTDAQKAIIENAIRQELTLETVATAYGINVIAARKYAEEVAVLNSHLMTKELDAYATKLRALARAGGDDFMGLSTDTLKELDAQYVTLSNRFFEQGRSVPAAVKAMADNVRKALEVPNRNVTEWLKNMADSGALILARLQALRDASKAMMDEAFGVGKVEGGTSAASALIATISVALDKVNAKAATTGQTFGSSAEAMKAALESLDTEFLRREFAKLEIAITAVRKSGKEIDPTWKEVYANVGGYLSRLEGQLQDVMAAEVRLAAMNPFGPMLDAAAPAVRTLDRVSAVTGVIAQGFVNMAQVAGDAATEWMRMAGSMLVGVDNLVKGIGSVTGIIERVKKEGKSLKSAGLEIGLSLAAGIMEGIGGIMQGGMSGTLAGAITRGGMGGATAGSAVGAGIGVAIAGSMKGAMAGGIWGAAAGFIVGAIIAVWKSAPTRALMRDIGQTWGKEISEGLAQEIMKTADTLFGGSRDAAQVYNLAKIISETGLDTAKSWNEGLFKLHDTFSMLETKEFSLAQAQTVLNENFGTFVDMLGGKVTPRLREIIKLNDEFGTQSKAIAQFVDAEANKALQALGGFVEMRGGVADALAEAQKKLDDLRKKGAGSSEIKKAREEVEKLKKQLEGLPLTAGGADAIGAAMFGIFERLTRDGASAVGVMQQIAPVIDALGKQLESAGMAGGSAFDQIRSMVGLVTDEISGPGLQAIEMWGQGLMALNNSAILTPEMFAGITGQITAQIQALQAQGKTTEELYPFIASSLQTIWELQNDYNYAVDEATQALLDEAEASGVVGDQHRSVQEQMLLGIGRIVDAVEGLAHAFGVTLPNDMQEAADAARRKASEIDLYFENVDPVITPTYNIPPFPNIKPPTVQIPTEYKSPGKPPDPYEGIGGGGMGGEYYGTGYAAGGVVERKRRDAIGYAEGGSVVSLADYKAARLARTAYLAVGGAVKAAGSVAAATVLATSLATPVYANRGMFVPKGTDTVPAMLTPREFVQPVAAVDRYGVEGMEAVRRGEATILVGGGLPKDTIEMARGGVVEAASTVRYAASGGAIAPTAPPAASGARPAAVVMAAGGGIVPVLSPLLAAPARPRGYADGGLVTSIGGPVGVPVQVSVEVATDRVKSALESIGREPVVVDSDIDTSGIERPLEELPRQIGPLPIDVEPDRNALSLTERALNGVTADRDVDVRLKPQGLVAAALALDKAVPKERPIDALVRLLGLDAVKSGLGTIPSTKAIAALLQLFGLTEVKAGIDSLPTERAVSVPLELQNLEDVLKAVAALPPAVPVSVEFTAVGVDAVLAELARIPREIVVAVITAPSGSVPTPAPVPSPPPVSTKPKLPPPPPDYRIPIPTPPFPTQPEEPDYRIPIPTPTDPWLSPWMTLARGGLVTAGNVVPVYAERGLFVPRGTDTVPAMLTPHEYVLPADVVARVGVPALDRLRDGDARVVSAQPAASAPPPATPGAVPSTTHVREIVRERTERSEGNGDVAIIVLRQGATIADVMAALPKRLAKNERQEAEKIAAKLQPYMRKRTT